MRHCLSFLLIVVLTFAPLLEAAQWKELSAEQQTVLKQFKPQWTSLSESEKSKLALGAQRWINLDSEQRSQLSQKFEKWQKLIF